MMPTAHHDVGYDDDEVADVNLNDDNDYDHYDGDDDDGNDDDDDDGDYDDNNGDDDDDDDNDENDLPRDPRDSFSGCLLCFFTSCPKYMAAPDPHFSSTPS